MKEKSFYKEYTIPFNRKASLAFFCCCAIFMFLFTFSCTSADNSTSTLSDNNTVTSDIDNDEAEEGSKINNNDETADIDDSPVVGENDVDEDRPLEDGELTINVYYADAMGEYLIGEARVISSENKYVDALNELMKLPIDSSLFQLIPDTAIINSIVVKDGLAKVDFSKEFIEDKFQGDTADILLIYSIVNTLTGFPEVNSVSFYIDGEKLDILGEIDIKEPIFRKSDLIK